MGYIMEVLIYTTIILISNTLYAKPHCQPTLYDAIYLRLVKENLRYNIEKLNLINREGFIYTNPSDKEPDVFKIFRQLCYGQKTSFEVKKTPKVSHEHAE